MFNPFVPNAPFLYPLKTSENLTVFSCFQGIEKGCIGNDWVKAGIANIEQKTWAKINFVVWLFKVHGFLFLSSDHTHMTKYVP